MCMVTTPFGCPDHHNNCNQCLHCNPRQYIRLVQHLIEKCLVFCMDRDECVRALETHARIQPAVTLAVWTELLKENPQFFSEYHNIVRREVPKFQQNGTLDS